MTRRNAFLSVLAGAALAIPGAAAAGDTVPAEGSKSMGDILRMLEERGAGVVTELEYAKGAWEGVVCKEDACHRVQLDAKTGAETSRKEVKKDGDLPPSQAMSLSSIVEALETRELGVPTEVEFDDGLWEADFVKDGKKKEVKLDPLTGQEKA